MPDGLTDAMNPLGTASPTPQQIPMAPPPDPNAPQQQSSPLSGQLTPPAQSQVPALQPDPSAIKHVSKLASIGHVFNTLAGTSNDYQVDPKTGQTVATPIKQKPGQMFRNMLAGALMGGAAGAGNDFATGLIKGGGAGVQDQRNQDLQRRAQAQQQFQNEVTTNREKQEDLRVKAELAHYHAADLQADAQMNLMQQEHLDKLNEYNSGMNEKLGAIGVLSPVMVNGENINGKVGNGSNFSAAYTKDPRAFDAPPGYQRIHTQTVNYDGLKFDKEKRDWVDEAGKPVDLASRTTHSFYDVPTNDLNKSTEVSGRELNSLLGYKQFDDEAKINTTVGALVGMKRQATLDQISVNKAKLEIAQTNLDITKSHAEIAKTNKEFASLERQEQLAGYENAKISLKVAEDKLSFLKTQIVDEGDPRVKEAQEALDDAQKQFDILTKKNIAAMEAEKTGKKGGAAPAPTATTTPAPAGPAVGTPAAAAQQAQAAIQEKQTTAQQAEQMKQDQALVNSYESPGVSVVGRNARPNLPPQGPSTETIVSTLKANPGWTTSQKAEFIKRVLPLSGKQWSASGWLAKNKGGDVNAAKAQAQAQGAEIVQ